MSILAALEAAACRAPLLAAVTTSVWALSREVAVLPALEAALAARSSRSIVSAGRVAEARTVASPGCAVLGWLALK